MSTAARFDAFTDLPTSANIKNEFIREYSPIASLSETSVIEFVVPPSGSLFIDLPKTRLKVRLSVYDGDGKIVDATKKVATCANTLGSLFQHCDIALNNVQMNIPEGNNGPYRNYVNQLLTRDTTYAESIGKVEGLLLDSARYTDADDVVSSSNKGLRSRYQMLTSAGGVHLSGYLTADFFQVKKLMPSNLGINIRFFPVRDDFLLICKKGDETKYKFKIESAALIISYVEPSDEIFVAFNEALKQRPALFEFPRNDLKSYVLSKDSSTCVIDNCLSQGRPTSVFVYLLLNKSYAGSYHTSPLSLKTMKVSYASLSYEGEILNGYSFSPTFIDDTAADPKYNQNFLDAYSSLYHRDGNQTKGNLITPLMFREGFFILRWDLSPDVRRANKDSNTLTGLTRISFRFEEALPETVTAIVHSISVGHFAIDSARNVILEPSSVMQH